MTPEERAIIDNFLSRYPQLQQVIDAKVREAVEQERAACLGKIEEVAAEIERGVFVPDTFHYGAGYALGRATNYIEARGKEGG